MNEKYLNTCGKLSSVQKIEIHVSLNMHVTLEYSTKCRYFLKTRNLLPKGQKGNTVKSEE